MKKEEKVDKCYIVLYTVYAGVNYMYMIISNSSPTPIYEQIKNEIIKQIMSGELEENEAIPSIRALAGDIKISVMTIKKAYDELLKEGYIVSIQGKGTFVAPKNTSLRKENIQKSIEGYISKAVEEAIKNDIKKEEIHELVDIFYGE